MTQQASQELIIVRAVANLELPNDLGNMSRVGALVKRMGDEGKALRYKADALERARQAKRDGNFIGNWFKGRQEAMDDAQMDLNKAIGNLTASTSELLVINTALSKVLHIQQEALHDQQAVLEGQADEIREQNVQILHQQEEQARQQEQIIRVNEGILEAKGLTQEQALKLVGCVERVTEAEQALKLEVRRLELDVEERLAANVAHTAAQMSALQDSLTLAHDGLLASLANLHETVILPLQAEQEALRNELGAQLRQQSDALAAALATEAEARRQFEQQHAAALAEHAERQDHVLRTAIAGLTDAVNAQLRQQSDSLAAALVTEAEARRQLVQQHAAALAEHAEQQGRALAAAVAESDRRWEAARALQQTDNESVVKGLRLTQGVTAVALVVLLLWQLLA